MTTAVKSEIDLQNAGRKFVDLHVYACVSSLVDYIIKKSLEDSDAPISYDELNLRPDPSDWDAEKLNAYLIDPLGTTWMDVTGEDWHVGRRAGVLGNVAAWLPENCNFAGVVYRDDKNNPIEIDDWSADQLFACLRDSLGLDEGAADEKWNEIANWYYSDTVATDVEAGHLLKYYDREMDKVRDYICENADAKEPLEWWIISTWLAQELKAFDEVIVDCGGGLVIWGRETSGQAIFMDGEIEAITLKWLEARGEA